ncbi:MAG: ATP phosphoribosyltransferase regulatory subunit [Ferroplasma sp.]|uniref:ATP phosphoribosyltransferase regulatory subunit n=1 Tax=Ferroplasma sp. TaxID=2591003 RepID=UPI00281523F3|nr:ATP phosphoribosyltransferase regulatory subunit [Ferroplasma sp.]WMT51130.1 MAG: ATP phosphoribosyltransferase regulatory subunit [Ferroplasma sp.]
MKILDRKLGEIARRVRESFYDSAFYEVFPASYIRSNNIAGFRFIYRNEVFVLEPDITLRLMEKQFPPGSNIFYVSVQSDRNLAESLKTGGEIIGGDPTDITIKILKTAIKILDGLGLSSYSIDMGISGIFDKYKSSSQWAEIKKALRSRDFQALNKINSDDRSEIIKIMGTRTRSSRIETLDAILAAVNDSRVIIDLGTVRQPDYYNGPVFEIYNGNEFIGGGGNYSIHGINACGFTMDLMSIYRMYNENMEAEK